MTFIHDDPREFRQDAMSGFVAAYGRYVRAVPGASGVMRAGGSRAGKVSLVVGGGSGHYPSYAGIVGTGYADACVLGDVFTSPSAKQCYRVARAAHGGGGVVFAFGNYAGDRLNFAAARERLVDEGMDTRIVYVTDDIASAPRVEADRRRGIAGTAIVYKIGGAAADFGYSIDEVERVMRAANAATVSYGVAFRGCTLPGARSPLFSVAEGRMDFGLGIHGEPGVREADWMPARRLADELVDALIADRPIAAATTRRAALVVNGLGATKYEELFVLYRHVAARLANDGIDVVNPEVGELVTSLDMAGCSVSITWLDSELERLWNAPAETAAFRRTGDESFPVFPVFAAASSTREAQDRTAEDVDFTKASAGAAAAIRRALRVALEAVTEAEAELGRVDAVAGDGDHGQGMVRGLTAAVAAAEDTDGGAGTVLRAAGDAFADHAGGTSGILWGVALDALGRSLGDRDHVTGAALVAGLMSATETIQRVGGARRGDKTMLDSLLPFVERLSAAADGESHVRAALASAVDEARTAAAATAALRPKVGRARPLADRSVGTPDAGALSVSLVIDAVAKLFVPTPFDSGAETAHSERKS